MNAETGQTRALAVGEVLPRRLLQARNPKDVPSESTDYPVIASNQKLQLGKSEPAKQLRRNSGKPRAAIIAVLFALVAALATSDVLASRGYAATADDATVQALEELAGDGKILSVSEGSDFFKVKVLVDGKVRVVRIRKQSAAGNTSDQ